MVHWGCWDVSSKGMQKERRGGAGGIGGVWRPVHVLRMQSFRCAWKRLETSEGRRGCCKCNVQKSENSLLSRLSHYFSFLFLFSFWERIIILRKGKFTHSSSHLRFWSSKFQFGKMKYRIDLILFERFESYADLIECKETDESEGYS